MASPSQYEVPSLSVDASTFELDTLKKAVQMLNPSIQHFETSCFDGRYITGDVTAEYLENIENARDNPKHHQVDVDDDAQLDLNLILEGQG